MITSINNLDAGGVPRRYRSTANAGVSAPDFIPDTWNSADKGSAITLSNADLTAAQATGAWQSIRSKVSKTGSGKFYCEIDCVDIRAGNAFCMVGVSTSTPSASNYLSFSSEAHMYYALDGTAQSANSGESFGNSFTDGDVIGIAVDITNEAVYFAKNNTWQNSSDPTSGASRTGVVAKHYLDNTKSYFIGLSIYSVTNDVTFVPSPADFTYSAPSGYTAGWG